MGKFTAAFSAATITFVVGAVVVAAAGVEAAGTTAAVAVAAATKKGFQLGNMRRQRKKVFLRGNGRHD